MYMQGIDFTFYWLTGEKTHLYLGCWENKRSKKLVNGVLPVCLLSYFLGKPKESAAWWALGIQRFINHWSRKCFCKGPVIIYRRGGGGAPSDGASRMIFCWTPPFKWCFTEVILLMTLDKFRDSSQSFRRPKKKSSSTTGRKKESKRKVQKTMQGEATRGTSALVKLRTSWDCRHLSLSRMDAFILHALSWCCSSRF